MFATPFPPKIKFCCLEEANLDSYAVHEEEKACIQSVKSAQYQNDFLLGRACAHEALSMFQLAHLPILRNENRSPIWPKSIVGSITHSGHWAAAAVGHLKQIKGIGIDLENLMRPLHKKIQKRICTSEEQEWLAQYPQEQSESYLKILFSAKESIFKCFHPLTGVYLQFQDAQIIFETHSSSFKFKLLKDCGLNFPIGFQHGGAYQICQNLVLTSIWIPAEYPNFQ